MSVLAKVSIRRRIKENRYIRFMAIPYMRVREYYRRKKYLQEDDPAYFRALKGGHAGERCFVIGNGPSLLPEDLDKLAAEGETCFGTNRIYCIYPQTKWRPDYYICFDMEAVSTLMQDIKDAGDYPKFINYKGARFGREEKDNIHYIFVADKFMADAFKQECPTLRDDVDKGVTRSATVTVAAIEMAIYMGFKTIYLLGVDNNYSLKRFRDGHVVKDTSVQTSYFAGMEDPRGGDGTERAVQAIDFMNDSYTISRTFAEERGVKIYNATRGGKLEVFERVDFDSLFKESRRAE